MALQSSGSISLNEIHIEAGGSSGTSASINDSDIRDLINKSSATQMSFSEWYGASAAVDITSGTTINGQSNRQEITVSNFISSGGTLRIPSGFWIWSDSTSTPAMTIDIPCTILNEGKIIGKGGAGGYGASNSGNGYDGGDAIKINSGVSNVTITNSSGAFIGGGGGGGGASNTSQYYSGGGGGAGGGFGGNGNGAPPSLGGDGGILNAQGVSPQQFHPNGTNYYGSGGIGGDAGGGGVASSMNSSQRSGGGGGGGRIIPGSASSTPNQYHSSGGGAGNAGTAGGAPNNFQMSGGGGGWGAAGGDGYTGVSNSSVCQGGAGGKAIEDTGNSYTLNNSGTIYGATT